MSQGFSTNGNIVITGTVDTGNSTTTPLLSAATFTGTSRDVSAYSSVIVSCLADVAGTLYIEFSINGTNWDSSLSFTVSAATNEVHRVTVTRQYFRIRYVNNGTNQTYFRLQTLIGSQSALSSGLNAVVQQDADSLVVRNIDSEIDIANSKYVGYSIVNKAGINTDIDTGSIPEDIWDVGGTYTGFPNTSGETISVLSSSATDTNGNASGAWTVRITGLDADYNTQSETFTLNGTTPVTGALTFTRVHTAQVVTSGTSNSVFNVGTITVRHTTTTANVFLSIRPGTNQSNCSAYTIPAGYTAFMRTITTNILSASATTAAADYSIWTQSALKTNAPRLRRPSATYYGGETVDVIYGGLIFTEKTDMILRVTNVSANNTSITGGYDLILIKN